MQKYKKISRFLTFKRFLYQTEEYFYYYFEKTNRNYTNILFFFPTKQKQVSILFLSLPSNLIEVILNKFMSYLITPEGYKPLLDLKQTELGIKQIKEFFQLNLSSELRLRRVTAPLFVLKGMGINDDLTPDQGYRQESCALFRQPHKPAVRCGYPSSRVTSR